MFAPKVAKANTKAAKDLSSKLVPQRSPLLGVPIERLEPSIDNEAWDFSKIPVFPSGRIDRPSASSPLSALTPLQTKLEIGAVDDPLEREAERVAEQLTGTSDDRAVVSATSGNNVLRRNCAFRADRQNDDAHEEDAREEPGGKARQETSAPPIVREVVSSHGHPLDPGVRELFESRLGYDFSHVRVHTGEKAAESAQAVNAAAYTVGQDLVFGAGQYAPQTSDGRRLLAHELTHTVQQSGLAHQLLQRTEQQTLKLHGRPSMTVVIGELRFSRAAKADVLKFGALLPSADQAHIGFYNDKLGYDPSYTDPTDPDRWNKLKDIIDSDAKILVEKSNLLGAIKVLFITPKSRVVIDDQLRSLGLTLPTEALEKQIFPNQPTMTVSPSADTNQIYYTTAMGSPADSSLAHELFGHMWLALKGVPFIHPSQPAAVAAQGTLTAKHGIRDPFGNIYTGTVQDYIDRYVGSESGMLASPTQNVGPQLLRRALSAFNAAFSSATGSLNGAWKVSKDADEQWEIISGNYALAPNVAAPPKPSSPATQSPTAPAPKPAAPQNATQPATPGTAPTATQTPPTSPAVTQNSVEQDVTAWYRTLDRNKQYVFISFLESVQSNFTRRTQLASRLLKTLSRPPGMTPPPSSIP
jgi:hypothetical protein